MRERREREEEGLASTRNRGSEAEEEPSIEPFLVGADAAMPRPHQRLQFSLSPERKRKEKVPL